MNKKTSIWNDYVSGFRLFDYIIFRLFFFYGTNWKVPAIWWNQNNCGRGIHLRPITMKRVQRSQRLSKFLRLARAAAVRGIIRSAEPRRAECGNKEPPWTRALPALREGSWRSEISTLPSEGTRRGGGAMSCATYALVWKCNISSFPQTVQFSTEPRSPGVHAPSETHRRVRKVI